MTSRVFLVGFMGSGKTTVGKLLAAALGYEFLDLDDWIENQEGKTITKIFSEIGEIGFRASEHKYLRTVGMRENLVLSTGGGTPCHHQNMEWMNAQGTTIFLHTPEEKLFERLTLQKQHRPLIAAMDESTLKSFILSKLMDRLPYYIQSRIELIDMPSPEVSVKNLIKILS
ncbi:MAG: shikimate kinase [Saprospiraceae bacterium]|nr:shikimate kinase [Saprospiraceae bacterium]